MPHFEGNALARRLVPDALWAVVEPLIPAFERRRQGGGSAPLNERAVFAAVVYVLADGCAWRQLPPSFGVSPATAHRRYAAWTAADMWTRLHRAARSGEAACEQVEWVSAIVAAAASRAPRRRGRPTAT